MALKRSPSSYVHTVRPGFVRLYLDDLDGLVEVARAAAEEVQLEVGQMRAEIADDLASATRAELQDVVIETRRPRVRAYLGKESCRVIVLDDTDEGVALAESMARVLERHRSTWSGVGLVGWQAFRGAALTWAVSVLIWWLIGSPTPDLTGVDRAVVGLVGIGVLVLLTAFYVLILVALYRSRSHMGRAWVVPQRRAAAAGQRHNVRIAIITAIVSGPIGAVLGFLLGRL
jgi:hypothetical protein